MFHVVAFQILLNERNRSFFLFAHFIFVLLLIGDSRVERKWSRFSVLQNEGKNMSYTSISFLVDFGYLVAGTKRYLFSLKNLF